MAKTSLYLSRLSNDEFSRLVTSLLRDWQASHVTLDDVVLTKLKTKLTQQSELFRDGLAVVKDKALRQELEEADKIRDQDLQILAEMVKLGRYARTTEEKAAYQLLSPLFTGLAKAKQANYEEESAYVNRLLKHLKEEKYQESVRQLNMTKAIQTLSKSQAAFEALLLKRHTTNNSKLVYDNKANRKALQETYTRLGDYLYITSEEIGTPAYQKLYRVYQTNSDLFKPLTINRKAKTEKTQPEETD